MTRAVDRRLYSLAFVEEFGPLFAVYTLWFNDNGITTAQTSTVFIGWAAVSLILEIPSGALADRVDRRRLIATAFALRAVGIATWLVWPSLTGFAIGAVLWAAHDALASGSWEALVHDELTATEDAHRYASVMARVGQFSHLGIAAGTLLGAALLRVDIDLAVLGWITVVTHVGSILLVWALPDVRWVTADAPGIDGLHGHEPAIRAWWETMRSGVAEVRHVPVLARLAGLGAVLEGLFLLDEYIPLLTRIRGGGDSVAPVIVCVVWIGLLAGGEIAARRPAESGRVVGGTLIVAMGITGVAFVDRGVASLGLVAIGYAALQVACITTDARLQELAPSATRATVTSVAGFGSACVSIVMFAVIGALTLGDDPSRGLLAMIGVLMVAGVLVVRWLPPVARTLLDRCHHGPGRAPITVIGDIGD